MDSLLEQTVSHWNSLFRARGKNIYKKEDKDFAAFQRALFLKRTVSWYGPLPISGKAVSFQLQESGPVQSHNLSVEEQEENLLPGPAEKRIQRHADAIFTDSYRKVRGKMSAQKLLQGIVGKRLGRQSDSILMDSRYHQQMVLRNVLGAMLQNQRPQDISTNHLEDFVSVLAKLMEL
ncbi:Somatoliberin [Varanus komodoensis]|nr:Somatoliberin [Varanus komodoensis]